MKRSLTDCQNAVDGNVSHHHARQRFSVTAAMGNRSHSPWAEVLPDGDTSINITAKYTRRPANRTDCGVSRRSQRPQVKLNREEYSPRTAAGQPRGLRG